MARQIYRAQIDRPIGYRDRFGNSYPINYGYIPEIQGGDGEAQDVYVISSAIDSAISCFEGELVAIIHRRDDIETKWVLTGQGEQLTAEEIASKTHFIEQYFDSWIELLP